MSEAVEAVQGITPESLLESLDVAIVDDKPIEALHELRGRVRQFLAAAKALAALVDDALIEHIKTDGPQEIRVGEDGETVRYKLGYKTVKKVRDVPECLRLILETSGPDAAAFCLSSGAFKFGELRKTLDPDDYTRLVEEVRQDTLNGAPRDPELVVYDGRFMKGRA